MRWEALFEDLEGQMAAAEAVDASAAAAAMVRAEFARTALVDRLRGQIGGSVSLRLLDGRWLRGALTAAGPGWLLLLASPSTGLGGGPVASSQVLVRLEGVERFADLGAAQGATAGAVAQRLGWGGALRALARDRSVVTVMLPTGDLTGTLDRVGSDHVDVAVHPADVARRRAAITEVASLPFSAVLGVRSAG